VWDGLAESLAGRSGARFSGVASHCGCSDAFEADRGAAENLRSFNRLDRSTIPATPEKETTMSEQQEAPKAADDVETSELGDDDMEAISGGLPNGAVTTQNGEGSGYGGLSK
jgi:hypothetical protein